MLEKIIVHGVKNIKKMLKNKEDAKK